MRLSRTAALRSVSWATATRSAIALNARPSSAISSSPPALTRWLEVAEGDAGDRRAQHAQRATELEREQQSDTDGERDGKREGDEHRATQGLPGP